MPSRFLFLYILVVALLTLIWIVVPERLQAAIEILAQLVVVGFGIFLALVFLQQQNQQYHESSMQVVRNTAAIRIYGTIMEHIKHARAELSRGVDTLASVLIPVQTGLWIIPGTVNVTAEDLLQGKRALEVALDDLILTLRNHQVVADIILRAVAKLDKCTETIMTCYQGLMVEVQQAMKIPEAERGTAPTSALLNAGMKLRAALTETSVAMTELQRDAQIAIPGAVFSGRVFLPEPSDNFDVLRSVKTSEMIGLLKSLKASDPALFKSLHVDLHTAAGTLLTTDARTAFIIYYLMESFPPVREMIGVLERLDWNDPARTSVLKYLVKGSTDANRKDVTRELMRLKTIGTIRSETVTGWLRSMGSVFGVEALQELLQTIEWHDKMSQMPVEEPLLLSVQPRSVIQTPGTMATFDVFWQASEELQEAEIHVEVDGVDGPLDPTDIVVGDPDRLGARVTILPSESHDRSAFRMNCDTLPEAIRPTIAPWPLLTVTTEIPNQEGVITCKARIAAKGVVYEDAGAVFATRPADLQLSVKAGILDEMGTLNEVRTFAMSRQEDSPLVVELQVTNEGSYEATSVRVDDANILLLGILRLSGIRFVSQGTVTGVADNDLRWNIGTLGPGTGATLRVGMEVLAPGVAKSKATLSADQIHGGWLEENEIEVAP